MTIRLLHRGSKNDVIVIEPLTFSPLKSQVQTSGSLLFPPFRAEDYKQEVHAQIYRCVARNSAGSIVSRDIHVRAGRTFVFARIFFSILQTRPLPFGQHDSAVAR